MVLLSRLLRLIVLGLLLVAGGRNPPFPFKGRGGLRPLEVAAHCRALESSHALHETFAGHGDGAAVLTASAYGVPSSGMQPRPSARIILQDTEMMALPSSGIHPRQMALLSWLL